MSARLPGELIAARVAVMPDGDVAEIILTERAAPYKERLREAYARWFGDGAWSAWHLVAEAVNDVSITADASGQEPSALIAVVVWVRVPSGVSAADHDANQLRHFRLTRSGVTPVDL